MSRTLRRLHAFAAAVVTALAASAAMQAGIPEARAGDYREPPVTRVALFLPARAPPSPLLGHAGTPAVDCQNLANPDRAIQACTALNASKNLARRTRAQALSNRCGAYIVKGMADKAIADCDRAIRMAPSLPVALYNRGRAYRAKNDLPRAIADYSEAIRIWTPASRAAAKALNNRGEAYAKEGDAERALADFGQAIKLSPDYAKALYNRAVVYGRQGELDRAIAEYTRAIEADPALARAFNGRGQAYLRKQDTVRAVADFNAALRLDQTNASARRNLERATAVASAAGVAAAGMELAPEQLESE
ncbi:MAG: peptidase caspase catalytic subunit p20 [Microvirga sp.]|jgi:tetratricopeptide (TPR) repeat protein|nr:peptidase caspase catalytic subunit p20 [Microvirga sp.]